MAGMQETRSDHGATLTGFRGIFEKFFFSPPSTPIVGLSVFDGFRLIQGPLRREVPLFEVLELWK